MTTKQEDPVMGIPYAVQYHQQQPYYYVGHEAGAIPPNVIVGDPKGIPIRQNIYRDTPAPINCLFCGTFALSTVRSKPGLAVIVGYMMPMILGICFLCPYMDCLWHKYHYCPYCNEKVADVEKSDPCNVMDPLNWTQ